MNAACSAKKLEPINRTACRFCMCMCVLRITYKKDGTVNYEATDPPRTSDITWFTSMHYK